LALEALSQPRLPGSSPPQVYVGLTRKLSKDDGFPIEFKLMGYDLTTQAFVYRLDPESILKACERYEREFEI
jgi:hypothetical protein